MDKKIKERPALLELLNARASWNQPPFQRPLLDAKRIETIEAAARAYARANRADSWAYLRMKMQLVRGLDSPHDVLEAARKHHG